MRPNTNTHIVLDSTLAVLSLRKLETLTGQAVNLLANYKPATRAELSSGADRGTQANIVDLRLFNEKGKLLHRFELKLVREGTKVERTKVALTKVALG